MSKNKGLKNTDISNRLFKTNIYWIIGVLVSIIIILASIIIYIKKDDSISISDLISISSGFVSIALAIFAIIYSVSESIKTNTESKRNSEILDTVKSISQQVHKKLSELDDKVVDQCKKVSEIIEQYKNSYISGANNVEEEEIENLECNADGKDVKEEEMENLECNSDNKEKETDTSCLKKYKKEILRGDIFFADFSTNDRTTLRGKRLVVVVQNDIANKYSPTVLIAPLTTKLKKTELPTNVKLDSDNYSNLRDAVVITEQILTIDKRKLKIGRASCRERGS